MYVSKKKKKKKEEEQQQTAIQETSQSGGGNGILYTGLTQAQTRKLQEKLNDFISQGGLGYIIGLLGAVGEFQYTFVRNQDGTAAYKWRYVQGDSVPSWDKKEWCSYWGWAYNDGSGTAYEKWVADGEPSGRVYNKSGDVISQADATITTSPTSTNSNSDTKSEAISKFMDAIQPSLTAGKLKVDGAYGKNTMAVVTALQVYLNSQTGANLQVDGKYGKQTDAKTGWGIC